MITVVIPALNEDGAIGQTVSAISDTLAQADLRPFEIVVIDDGSSDHTRREAEKAGARVIVHMHNLGYGRSIKDGILAGESRYNRDYRRRRHVFDRLDPGVGCALSIRLRHGGR